GCPGWGRRGGGVLGGAPARMWGGVFAPDSAGRPPSPSAPRTATASAGSASTRAANPRRNAATACALASCASDRPAGRLPCGICDVRDIGQILLRQRAQLLIWPAITVFLVQRVDRRQHVGRLRDARGLWDHRLEDERKAALHKVVTQAALHLGVEERLCADLGDDDA